MFLTIDNNTRSTLTKEMLDVELNDIVLDTITYMIVAYIITYIRYYGVFSVNVCKRLIQQSLQENKISAKYHQDIMDDVFRILENEYNVKQQNLDFQLYDLKQFEEMKNIKFQM